MPSESYQAAAFLLRASCLGHLCDDTILDDTNETIEWDELERFALSLGERTIVAVALDLFNGCGGAKLNDVVNWLDDAHFAAVVEALQLRRPGAFTTNLVATSTFADLNFPSSR